MSATDMGSGMGGSGMGSGIERFGDPAPLTRIVGWGSLGALAAFLINNVLNVGFGFAQAQAILSGDSGAWPAIAVYVICIGIGIAYALMTPRNALRWDADRIHRFNVYLIRSFYFGILFVGIADIIIAFMRTEHLFDGFLSPQMVLTMQRPDYIGLHVHLPLVVLGFIVGLFTRTLGFLWLSLLIIIAELAIVITRFVFSYEQAFMGDLVRYWYSALFLLASAHTLHEEGHVRVDILYAGLKRRTKGIVNAWGVILLGMPTAWTVLAVGFAGPQSIINSPVMNFEITQTGGIGMYVKYQMAAFLGIFGMTMLIEFVAMLFDSVADWRGEPGHRDYDVSAQ